MSVSILFHADEHTKLTPSNVNPHLVTLTLNKGDHSVDLFMSAKTARQLAALALADADRCEAHFQSEVPAALVSEEVQF
jgi:hypothetical protein